MIIIELNDYHSSFNQEIELQNSSRNVRQNILNNNYKQVYADEINTIFIL